MIGGGVDLTQQAGHRAVVISDVLLYRDGVAAGLARAGAFAPICVADPADILDVLADQEPDVVFLDMTRPAALALSRALVPMLAGTPIIGFGVASHDEALACAEAGISAFVGADGTIDDLAQAALLALEGKAVISPTLAALLVQRIAALSEAHSPPNATLTRREREIACLIDHGLSNKEIASSLKISPATVKNHVHTILEKLNVTRRNAIGRSLSVNRRDDHRRLSSLRGPEPTPAELPVRAEPGSAGRVQQLSLG